MVILGFCLLSPSLPSQVQAFYLGEDQPFFRLPERGGKGDEGGGVEERHERREGGSRGESKEVKQK